MKPLDWIPLDWIDEELDRLDRADLLRKLPPPLRSQGATVEVDGTKLLNFASNDYLGLAADERLARAMIDTCRDSGVGRGASPLVCGRSHAHAQLELRLATFMETESALLFPTSFAANAGIIPAMVDRGDAIYGDAKNHASIIDGCRLSRAQRHIFPHSDVEALEKMLGSSNQFRRRLIVTDALFSMDGDLAPLERIGELAARYNAMLMVDETHAVGVFGPYGRGIVEHLAVGAPALPQQVHIRVGTFGKALGAAGGFVCGSTSLIRWLANRARTYVFSTAHPAGISAAAMVALDIVATEPERRTSLLAKAEGLRQRLRAAGWDTGQSVSQIIPLRVATPAAAIGLSQTLRDRGIWLPAIRPPSVPPEGSLLRLGLTWAHSDAMLDQLVETLGQARASKGQEEGLS